MRNLSRSFNLLLIWCDSSKTHSKLQHPYHCSYIFGKRGLSNTVGYTSLRLIQVRWFSMRFPLLFTLHLWKLLPSLISNRTSSFQRVLYKPAFPFHENQNNEVKKKILCFYTYMRIWYFYFDWKAAERSQDTDTNLKKPTLVWEIWDK